MPSRNTRPASSRTGNRQNNNYYQHHHNNSNSSSNNRARRNVRPRFQSSQEMEAQQLAEGVLRALKSNEDDLSEAFYRRRIYSHYDRCINLLDDSGSNNSNRGADISTATKTVQTILRCLDTTLGRYVNHVVSIERRQQQQQQQQRLQQTGAGLSLNNNNNNNNSRHHLHVLKQGTAALENWLHDEFMSGIGRAVAPLCTLHVDLVNAMECQDQALDVSSCDGFLRRAECERVMTEMRRREETLRLVLARAESWVAEARGMVAGMMTVVAAVVRDGWLRHERGIEDVSEWIDEIGKEVAVAATGWGVGVIDQEETS